MNKLTHMNEEGRAKMVDVSDKPETTRTALAQSSIEVNDEIYEHIRSNKIKKGDVLAVAQVAGIMAAKKTWDLIPMCHPIPLKGVDLSFSWHQKPTDSKKWILLIYATVKTVGHTGVEMEALTAASTAALTVYDMCKAVDKGMVIGPTFLLEKTGGTKGKDYKRTDAPESSIQDHGGLVGYE